VNLTHTTGAENRLLESCDVEIQDIVERLDGLLIESGHKIAGLQEDNGSQSKIISDLEDEIESRNSIIGDLRGELESVRDELSKALDELAEAERP
jgi:chromosome segregation ATPase